MNKNRQIGLDGKAFISACLRRGGIFVLFLMVYGVLNAFSDILKLTGSSGAAMSTFTTTLLIYDFIVSLLLIVVLFYAYFLECGSSVPFLKHRPIVVFGLFRLGYYILLAYYVCYRALYSLTHTGTVSLTLFFFYACYFVVIMCCILANSYIYNVLTRNVIRRGYRDSFRRLARTGIIFQALLPITYIIARVTMKDAGDEFFTTAFCDTLRLCVCPLLLSGLWFLFLHSIHQVDEVFGEVDDALRNKRYQITYSALTDGKKGSKRQTASPVAAAAFLPAPSKTVGAVSAPQTPLQQNEVVMAPTAPVAPVAPPVPSSNIITPAEAALSGLSPEERAAAEATVTDAATEMAAQNEPQPEPAPAPKNPTAPIAPVVPVLPEQSLIQQGGTTMAYVADMAQSDDGVVSGVRVVPVVQEFNPFPEANAPLQGGRKPSGQQRPGGQRPGGNQRPNNHQNGHKNSSNRGGGKGNSRGGQGGQGSRKGGSANQRANQNRSSQNRSGQNRSGQNRSTHR